MHSGDLENIEGQAARLYWKHLYGESFKRNRDADDANLLLNYGDSILRAMTARACCAVGLHPTIGINHHNRYNAFCLADDIMEPFRPVVDRIVYNINPKNDDVSLDKETRKKLLAIPLEKVATADGKFALNDHLNTIASRLMKSILGGKNCLSFD